MISPCLSVNQQGHLDISGCDTVDLARQYGTPLYVMSEDEVRRACRSYAASFQKYYGGNGRPIYASKAFSCKEIYRIVVSEGLDVEVVSGGELYTALQAGVPGEKLHFQGNNKSAGELRLAVENGVGDIVVDNLLELDMLQRTAKEHGVTAGISLRVKPGIDAHTHQFIRTGQVDSKFGLDLQNGEALEAVKQALAAENLELRGLHCHIGSQILEKEPFVHAAEVMLDFYGLLRRELGVTLKHLNLGGGFGIHYKEEDAAIPYEEYMEVVSAAVHRKCGELDLPQPFIYIEPGRSIVGRQASPCTPWGPSRRSPGCAITWPSTGACSTTPVRPVPGGLHLPHRQQGGPARGLHRHHRREVLRERRPDPGARPYPEAGDRGHPGGALHRGVQLFHGLQLQPEPEAPLRDGLPGQLPGHHQGGDLRGPGAQRHLTPGV